MKLCSLAEDCANILPRFPPIPMNQRKAGGRHIDLDALDKNVKQFFLSLQMEPEGSLLEVRGRPVARVLPIVDADVGKLKEAILSRRDESRVLNAEWEHADREVWQRSSDDK